MALLPSTFLHCVLAIGSKDPSGQPAFLATGFVYGHPAGKTPSGQGRYQSFVVSNRHVFEGIRASTVVLRCNPSNQGGAIDIEYPIAGPKAEPLWTAHPDPDVDVAVLSIHGVARLRDKGAEVWQFKSDADALRVDGLKQQGVFEGDFVHVLGFPLGEVGRRRKNVVVRHGCIARIQDLLDGESPFYLLDAAVVYGNSGGPVILRPEVTAICGTQPHHNALLIGVVSGFLPYPEQVRQPHGEETGLVAPQHSGLSIVWPVDAIDQVVEEHRKTKFCKTWEQMGREVMENRGQPRP